MKSTTPISEIKSKAKDALLGNYSLAIVSFVLLFALIYLFINLFSNFVGLLVFGSNAPTGFVQNQMNAIVGNEKLTFLFDFLIYFIIAIVTPIITILQTGFLFICREISYGRSARSSDLFFAIKNNPDRVIKISLIFYGISLLLELPSIIYGITIASDNASDMTFIINTVLTVLGAIVYYILSLAFAMTYLVYIDNPDNGALYCIRESITLMKGNMWRYFCFSLSFIGYYLLAILSLGIVLLWVKPYEKVAIVEFYKDLRERSSIDYRV